MATGPNDEGAAYGQFERRILVVLAGTSPAVVSETLFALARPDHRLHFIPTRIIVVTTTEGRTLLMERLLHPAAKSRSGRARVSWLQRMAEDLGLKTSFPLSEADIRVPKLESGDEINDAHSAQQLDAMGEVMFEALREATSDPGAAVFFSLSGGRKSMSHVAGQCMSALARPQDKLLHIIVEPAWIEGVEDFLYPVPGDPPVAGLDKEGEPVSVAEDAIELMLTEEPFFRLRPVLVRTAEANGLGPDALSFLQALALFSPPEADPLTLEISRGSGRARLGGRLLSFPKGDAPFMRAYLTLLAERRKLRHPLRDEETLALLAIKEEQDTSGADWSNVGWRRDQLQDLFEKSPTRAPAAWGQGFADYSLENVSKIYTVSSTGQACSLTKVAKDRAASNIAHLMTAWATAIPPLVDASLYDIRGRNKGWRELPQLVNGQVLS